MHAVTQSRAVTIADVESEWPIEGTQARPAPRPTRADDRDQRSGQPVSRKPPVVDVRNLALTVLAVLAVVLVLQYAQSVLIPIVDRHPHQLRARAVCRPALQRLRVPRAIGAAVAVTLLVGALRRGGLHAQRSGDGHRRRRAAGGAAHPRARARAPAQAGRRHRESAAGREGDRQGGAGGVRADRRANARTRVRCRIDRRAEGRDRGSAVSGRPNTCGRAARASPASRRSSCWCCSWSTSFWSRAISTSARS